MRRSRVIVLATVVLLVGAAVASEALMPRMAESTVRDRLAAFGEVTEVEVSTTPAIKLLLGDVDEATVRMSHATVDAASLDPDSLRAATRVDEVHARIEHLLAGPLEIGDVRIDKSHDRLDANAEFDSEQVGALIPGSKVKVEHGNLVLEIDELPLPLPIPGPIGLELVAQDGAVYAQAQGPLAGLLPPQPLLERTDLSVDHLRFSMVGGMVHASAVATVTA